MTHITPELRKVLGKKRYNVSYRIKHEMRVRGYSGRSLSREIGCSDVLISRTVNGDAHNPTVLDALRDIGIPEELLFDPRCATLKKVTVRKKKKETV